MLNLRLYLCRTMFEFETMTKVEYETEFEIFMNTSPGIGHLQCNHFRPESEFKPMTTEAGDSCVTIG